MERLTKRDKQGFAHYPYCFEKCDGDGVGIRCQTCDFEEKICDKLAEYEDLEEQGLLLKLPCNVGDTLYRIDTDENIPNKEIEPCIIDNIVICENGKVLFKYDAYDGVICHLENIITYKPYLDYYRIFLTEQEAQAAREKMKGE